MSGDPLHPERDEPGEPRRTGQGQPGPAPDGPGRDRGEPGPAPDAPGRGQGEPEDDPGPGGTPGAGARPEPAEPEADDPTTPPGPPRGDDPGAAAAPPPPPTGSDAGGAAGTSPPPPPQPLATPPHYSAGGQPSGAVGAATAPSADARNWALAAHLSAFANFVGVPWFVGPLVVWLIKRNDDPFIDEHGKEAVNFSLSLLIYGLGLLVVGGIITVLTLGLAIVLVGALFAALVIGWFVLVILASVKAANGELYRYPLTLRLIQ